MDGLGLNDRLRIGLTGGIGSGKSTAAKRLVELGATLIDTDAIARQLTGPQGAALPAIAARFGADLVGPRGLDRDAMRALVFGDPLARRDLERLLHPLILDEAESQGRRATEPTLVFDVPLLVESRHWRARVDRVLLIDCDEAVQRERVLQRPGWTAAALDGVLAAQASRTARRAAADAVIDNSRLNLDQLQQELQSLLRHWVPMKESRP
ncbi:MAG: dephospho-CoA kinase [Inhella sp.]